MGRQREAFGDAVVDMIAERAPNIRDLLLHRQVLTPLDIERTMGLSEGNIFQGEALSGAALPEPAGGGLGTLPHAARRSLDGGLIGASGGRVMGAPGRLAALAVLADERPRAGAAAS